MKIKIENSSYKYISDNSNECDEDTAFLVSKQNEKFLNDAKSKGAYILTPQVLQYQLGIDSVKIIGITGTNGKTTTAAAIYSFMLDLGFKTALQGTRGFFINEERVKEKGLTTPPLLETIDNIYKAKEQGCQYFVMEVSSHALDQGRVESLKFALKVFTNLTQDHLDYHKSFDEYKRVKSQFFADESLKLINKDSTKIEFNPKNCYTYALDAPASFNITAFTLNEGISAIVRYLGEQSDFYSPMHGLFNVYNLLAAISSVKLLTDKKIDEICEVVENFAGVSGRMEVVGTSPLIIVDFAHTPDGMQQVLDSMKDKELVVVFGAGGNRDKSKRVMMGRVANRFAKKIYLTSDNPRDEEPMDIIMDIYEGIEDKQKVKVASLREDAIRLAIQELNDGEVLMVLGKGDEEFQEIKGEKIAFDDRVVIREILNKKEG
ncbi:MAG: UDP-N-acetylmuramoyl-L-alanyl-D-glutamate--2,6-diaminopimelate ligase [Sulfurospirillum sp.]|nr:MAG: UDP-N-acetylmuramoyl-L-alanyl-D-glutamate--2,6-diaminopimelate ligase [Sulfurospirillum sp.]